MQAVIGEVSGSWFSPAWLKSFSEPCLTATVFDGACDDTTYFGQELP